MEHEILKSIQEEYEGMVRVLNGDTSELEELLTDKAVQSYFALKEFEKVKRIEGKDTNNIKSEIFELSENFTVKKYNLLKLVLLGGYDEDRIINDIVKRYAFGQIKATNEIWCYLHKDAPNYFAIKPECYGELSVGDKAYLYQNIEDFSKCVAVSKEKLDEFEENHQTVYGKPTIYDSEERYFDTRFHFFKDCILEGQEEAIRKVLAMKMR